MEKRISVILCTYNGEAFLREQLDSIVAQTYPIYELIIQDDGSTDNTLAIARDYASRYSFIQVIENVTNLGFNLNFKTAAMRCTGDFVAISDQDDVWFPEKIAKQVAAIGECDMCFSAYTRGENIKATKVITLHYSMESLVFNSIVGHSMLIRRDFVQRDDVWIPRTYYDHSLAIHAQMGRGIVRVDEPLNWHRSHLQSSATQQRAAYYKVGERPTWQPYVFGLKEYRKMQQNDNWQRFYRAIYEGTKGMKHRVAHKMVSLMLKPGILPLLQLGCICVKYRHEVYPTSGNPNGWRGFIRAFFTPFIVFYHNSTFDLKR